MIRDWLFTSTVGVGGGGDWGAVSCFIDYKQYVLCWALLYCLHAMTNSLLWNMATSGPEALAQYYLTIYTFTDRMITWQLHISGIEGKPGS